MVLRALANSEIATWLYSVEGSLQAHPSMGYRPSHPCNPQPKGDCIATGSDASGGPQRSQFQAHHPKTTARRAPTELP